MSSDIDVSSHFLIALQKYQSYFTGAIDLVLPAVYHCLWQLSVRATTIEVQRWGIRARNIIGTFKLITFSTPPLSVRRSAGIGREPSYFVISWLNKFWPQEESKTQEEQSVYSAQSGFTLDTRIAMNVAARRNLANIWVLEQKIKFSDFSQS